MLMKAQRIAISAGTFDPFTNGHLQMINPVLQVADTVIFAIGANPAKSPVFSLDERMKMLYEISRPYGGRVIVDQFPNEYQVDYAESRGANFIFRGLRNEDDFYQEQQWVNFNYSNMSNVVQLFLMPPGHYSGLSSSSVKRLVGTPGWEEKIKGLLPDVSYRMMLEKYSSPVLSSLGPPIPLPAMDAPRRQPTRGIYVSRFDPYTRCHEWMIYRALEVVDELVLGVSKEAYKHPIFDRSEITQMLSEELVKPFRGRVTVGDFSEEHRVDFAARVGAQFTFRDIRHEREFRKEKEKMQRNHSMHPEITQLFIIPPTEVAEHTSTKVRQLIGYKGWKQQVAKEVTVPILHRLMEKYDPDSLRKKPDEKKP